MSKEHWIQGAIGHRGALHKELGVPEDQVIPEKTLHEAAGKSGMLGHRARLALTLKGLHHGGHDHEEHHEHKPMRSTEDLKEKHRELMKKEHK